MATENSKTRSSASDKKYQDWRQYPTQRTQEVLASANKWLKFYFDKVKTYKGKDSETGKEEFIEHRYNRIVLNDGVKGTVVVPINSNKEIGLMNIFRYPVNSWSWEFPRGFGTVESSKEMDPAENAKKELGEEMGVRIPKGEKMIYLGEMFENSGICAGIARVYLALNVVPLPNENNKDTQSQNPTSSNDSDDKNNSDNKPIHDEKEEKVQLSMKKRDSVLAIIEKEDVEQIEKNKFVSYKEFQEMVKNGLIKDALTLSALQLAMCYDPQLFNGSNKNKL